MPRYLIDKQTYQEIKMKHPWFWSNHKAEKERTCSVDGEEYDDLLEETYTDLSCGHFYIGRADEVKYCPKCGAKVVSE